MRRADNMGPAMDRHNLIHPGVTKTGKRPYGEHSRHWDTFKYVYPVISRRSRGLSIGINLNPDTICNFDCVYCQVDKAEHPKPQPVIVEQVRSELTALLKDYVSGKFWRHPKFVGIDPELKRLNDIAFSGDGEPTTASVFRETVELIAELKDELGLNDIKIILITNATLLNRRSVESAICLLDANGGEVWAKLDAGTEGYYKRIDRSAVPYQTILENILACGRRRPIVIQTMLARLHEITMSEEEFQAYIQRLDDLVEQGCRIKAVQLYTVARQPLEPYISAVPDSWLSRSAEQLRHALPGIDVQWFGSRS